MVFVCIQFDCELWFHFRCVCVLFAFWCSWMPLSSLVCALCSLSCVQWCIKIRSPFFVPLAIWQTATDNHSQPIHKRDRTRAIFRLYSIFLRHSMKCYDKTSWILKRTHVFLINARMRSVRLMNSQAHAHATTPIAERNMVPVNTIRCSIYYYVLLFMFVNKYPLPNASKYLSLGRNYCTVLCHTATASSSPVSAAAIGRKQRRQQPAHSRVSRVRDSGAPRLIEITAIASRTARRMRLTIAGQNIEIIWQQKHLTMERTNKGTDNYRHTIQQSKLEFCVVSSSPEFGNNFFFFSRFLFDFPGFAVRTHWIYHRPNNHFSFFSVRSFRSRFAFSTKSTGNKTIRAVIHFMICVRCFSNCSTSSVPFCLATDAPAAPVTRTRLCRCSCSSFVYFTFSLSATTMMPRV